MADKYKKLKRQISNDVGLPVIMVFHPVGQ